MMCKEIEPNGWDIWERLVQSHLAFSLASQEFLSEGIDRVAIIRQALQGNSRNTAIYILQWLPTSELQQVFDQLIFLSSSEHGGIISVRRAILSIPKDWLLENIELAVEPYLQNGTGEEYRRFLELYTYIDAQLTRRLALRALEQQDLDTRAVGQDFMDRMEAA
jgi:hypothetical protein